jgi:hypothetical protein
MITQEEYEEAQEIVWDYENQLKEQGKAFDTIEETALNIDLVSGCFSFAKYFKENYKFWRYTKDNKETYQSEISGKVMTEEEIFEHWKSNNR